MYVRTICFFSPARAKGGTFEIALEIEVEKEVETEGERGVVVGGSREDEEVVFKVVFDVVFEVEESRVVRLE